MNLPALVGAILHPIGIFCSILVLLSILSIAIVNRDLANRMTVRLIASIAFADLISHGVELYASFGGGLNLQSSLCHTVNTIRLFGRTFYAFTNIAICFHLYRSLVQLKKSTWKTEIYTWIATLAMVIIFTILYGFLGAYTGVKHKIGCNPGADDKTSNTVFYLLAGSVDLLTILSCLFTTIVGHRSLNKWINTYAETRSNHGFDQVKFKRDRKKMAERAFLYPLSTCITLPFEAAFLYFNAFGIFVFPLGIAMSFTVGISGLLTFIAFCVDPAAHKSITSAYRQIKECKLYDHQTKDSISDSTVHIPLALKKQYIE